MPYNHPIPDAPIAPSMLPRVAAADLTSQDVLVLTQPGNNPGQKNKSYFVVSTNSSINALLAGTAIDVSVGDIVVLQNTGNSDITVTLGARQGSGGEETKSTTLKSLCAMQFMCCYQSGGYTHWVPLGNATVTWA